MQSYKKDRKFHMYLSIFYPFMILNNAALDGIFSSQHWMFLSKYQRTYRRMLSVLQWQSVSSCPGYFTWFSRIEVWTVISAWFQFRPLHLPTTEWWISLSTLFVAQVWTWINGLHSPILLERYLFKSSNIFEIFIFSANVRL